MKTLTCERCGLRVFFENVRCEGCGAALGFVPGEHVMGAFEVNDEGVWNRLVPPPDSVPLRPCANYAPAQVCNWMLPVDDASTYCLSCRTTQVLPALDRAENHAHWTLIEQAKRRLFYSLMSMGLPVVSKVNDPEHGVSFQFLEQLELSPKVMTGHDSGVITLNIAEADDARREQMRARLHEPYRTLLGHFRHEIGHYYWDRLICDSVWIDEYRALFGDERADYAEALKAHYATPLADWHLRFVSAYASAHSWEDWAECWAHYMHMQDGLETASAWGLQLHMALPGGEPVVAQPVDAAAPSLEPTLIERWLPISQFVNAMARSLGSHDSYPFVVPSPVIEKLEFIHKVVGAAARGEATMRFGTPAPVEEPATPAPEMATAA